MSSKKRRGRIQEVLMKHLAVLALSGLMLSSWAGLCSGQAFGHFTAAKTLGPDGQSAGAYFIVQDDMIGALSQFRYGASDALDFGFQLGIRSVDDYVNRSGLKEDAGDTHLLISGDAKYMLREADYEIPFDLSLDFGVGLADMDGANNLLFTLGGQGGWRGHEPESRGLEPYLGVVMVVERTTLEMEGGDKTETDTDLEIRVGTQYIMARAVSLVAEIQAGRETAFGVGLSFFF
jgi:hypothetical protein